MGRRLKKPIEKVIGGGVLRHPDGRRSRFARTITYDGVDVSIGWIFYDDEKKGGDESGKREGVGDAKPDEV